MIELFEQSARAMCDDQRRSGCVVRLPAHGRLTATGDLHDNPANLARIMTLARCAESSDHHVVLHEIIHGDRLVNGLDFSYRMLARAAALVLEYPGQVHPLLANHELAQMTGAGVSKGAGDGVDLFNGGLEYVFGDDWSDVAAAIGRFIRAMPLALISDSGVCCAHSLPNARLTKRLDLDVLNRDLSQDDYVGPTGNAYLVVWGRMYDDDSVQQIADAWGVNLFCLGHRHVDTGIERHGARVVVINSDHERATALPIDLSAVPDADGAVAAAVPLAAIG